MERGSLDSGVRGDGRKMDKNYVSVAAKGKDVETSSTLVVVEQPVGSSLLHNDKHITVSEEFPSMTSTFGKTHSPIHEPILSPKDLNSNDGDDRSLKKDDGDTLKV